MSNEHPDPVVVGRFPTEFEAALIRNMLELEGILCEIVGAITAGFRAETPGMVQLLVPGEYAEHALQLVASEIEGQAPDNDGSES